MTLQTGMDRLIGNDSDDPVLLTVKRLLAAKPFGLLFNQASLLADGRYACDGMAQNFSERLTCLFSPQHGIWGEQQANMIETGHSSYGPLRLPVYSLYSETRQPTAAMLAEIDVLVVDLQDVGTRVYTFAWTIVQCMRACANAGKSMVILDRPNPLGGLVSEGPCLRSEYRSFVGLAEIPMRHSLSLGELAMWASQHLAIDLELFVIPMSDWRRSQRFSDCGRHWMLPSPNMPTYRTTCVYPGGVLLEGTNLSEGRGTTIPFELVGAPFIDERELADRLNQRSLPGVRFRPTRFCPTFDKWQGRSCRGVYLDVFDELKFEAYRSTLHVLHAVRAMAPSEFTWLPPPYEYETEKLPIDILIGSDQARCAIDGQCDLDQLDQLALTESLWMDSIDAFRLYKN